jgi:hypothetical protein
MLQSSIRVFEVTLVRCTYDETVPVLDELQCQGDVEVFGLAGRIKSMFKKTQFLRVTMVKLEATLRVTLFLKG